jgi:hypothetical protein
MLPPSLHERERYWNECYGYFLVLTRLHTALPP